MLDSDNNTAIGYNALGKLTTVIKTLLLVLKLFRANDLNNGAANNALENTAVGYDALGDVTYGDYNLAIGKNSGNIIRGGTGNTFVGSGAVFPMVIMELQTELLLEKVLLFHQIILFKWEW